MLVLMFYVYSHCQSRRGRAFRIRGRGSHRRDLRDVQLRLIIRHAQVELLLDPRAARDIPGQIGEWKNVRKPIIRIGNFRTILDNCNSSRKLFPSHISNVI